MCWAAAASNLIHWWMDQNREYIAAYDKKYGPEYGDLKRPEKYTRMTPENQQHSEVFNFFKSSFGNQGSWDTGGCELVHQRKRQESDLLPPAGIPRFLQQGVLGR